MPQLEFFEDRDVLQGQARYNASALGEFCAWGICDVICDPMMLLYHCLVEEKVYIHDHVYIHLHVCMFGHAEGVHLPSHVCVFK